MSAQTITRADFFAALFPGAEGLIELRALPSGAQGFFARDDLDALIKAGLRQALRPLNGQVPPDPER